MKAQQVLEFVRRARRENPALYAVLRSDVPEVDELLAPAPALGDFSMALSAVGDWLSKNSGKLVDLTGKVMLAKQQAKIAKAQVKLQQAQQPAYAPELPGPLQQPAPLYTPATWPLYASDPAVPRMLGVPLIWWALGGVAVLGIMLARR